MKRGVPKSYCRYCGSTTLVPTSYLVNNSHSTLTQLTPTIAGNSIGGISKGRSHTSQLEVPTVFCKTCKNIECDCDEAPSFVDLDSDLTISVPHSLKLLFLNIDAVEFEVVSYFEQNINKIKRIIARYLSNGENPCFKKTSGFKHTMKLRSYGIKLGFIVELSKSGSVLIRTVYGGGKRICQ